MDLVAQEREVESERGDRLRYRQVGDPSGDEHGASELEVLVQQSVHGDQDRELQKHGETSSERTDSCFLVQRRGLLVHLLRVVLVLLLDGLQLRLDRGHLGGGGGALLGQRPEQDLDDYGQEDDSDTVVRDDLVQQVQDPLEDILEPSEERAAFHDGIERGVPQAPCVVHSAVVGTEVLLELGTCVEVDPVA